MIKVIFKYIIIMTYSLLSLVRVFSPISFTKYCFSIIKQKIFIIQASICF